LRRTLDVDLLRRRLRLAVVRECGLKKDEVFFAEGKREGGAQEGMQRRLISFRTSGSREGARDG
jgi:hypothetical protein